MLSCLIKHYEESIFFLWFVLFELNFFGRYLFFFFIIILCYNWLKTWPHDTPYSYIYNLIYIEKRLDHAKFRMLSLQKEIKRSYYIDFIHISLSFHIWGKCHRRKFRKYVLYCVT